jgi:hypothetical protein
VSQQPPVANEEARITIRHRRPLKWPVVLMCAAFASFWVGAGCLAILTLPKTMLILLVFATSLALFGCVGIGALLIITNPTSALRLGDDLDIGGLSFAPCEIERIVIAPDPQEDYCDEQVLLRKIEVYFRRIAHYRSVGVIAADIDADLTANWAAKFGIELVDCRRPPPPAEEVSV